jgi:hypothetical protein
MKRVAKRINPGDVYGRLTVIRCVRDGAPRVRRFECQCSCTNKCEVSWRGLTEATTRSCGCLYRERKPNQSHGLYLSRVYASWESMKARCFNPHATKHDLYGGRGITVCSHLLSSVINLIDIIGDRPPGKSLDRICVNSNYSCGKCVQCIENGWPLNIKWSTQKEQMRNTRANRLITINGQTMPLIAWSEKLNMKPHRVLIHVRKLMQQSA